MKIKNIVNGWTNLLLSKTIGIKSHIEAQATVRRELCNTCELNNEGTCSANLQSKHIITRVPVEGCGCPISAKTMAQDDYCPLGKWYEMVNAEIWEHVNYVMKLDKVQILNGPMAYNNGENYFTDIRGAHAYSYLQMAMFAAKGNLYTIALYDAAEVTDNLQANDSFIKAIQLLPEGMPVTLWVKKNTNPAISVDNFLHKCELLVRTLSLRTGRTVNYLFTVNDDITPVEKALVSLGVYLYGSIISPTIKERLQL